MGVRLEPQDEYMHELGPEPNFNESMYFNIYDPKNEVGGFFRLGNRANEGTGEMTCCVYLPDGRVARPIRIVTWETAGDTVLVADVAVAEAVTIAGVAPTIDTAPGASTTSQPER